MKRNAKLASEYAVAAKSSARWAFALQVIATVIVTSAVNAGLGLLDKHAAFSKMQVVAMWVVCVFALFGAFALGMLSSMMNDDADRHQGTHDALVEQDRYNEEHDPVD